MSLLVLSRPVRLSCRRRSVSRFLLFASQVQADADKRCALLQAVCGRSLQVEAYIQGSSSVARTLDLAGPELLPDNRVVAVEQQPELAKDPDLIRLEVNVMLENPKAPTARTEYGEQAGNDLLAREIVDGHPAANIVVGGLEWSGEQLVHRLHAWPRSNFRKLRTGGVRHVRTHHSHLRQE